jgi:hypothetical protein
MVRVPGKLFAGFKLVVARQKLAAFFAISLASLGLLLPLSAQDVSPDGTATSTCAKRPAETSGAQHPGSAEEPAAGSRPIQPGQAASSAAGSEPSDTAPQSDAGASQPACTPAPAALGFSAYLSTPGYFPLSSLAGSTFPQDSDAATLTKPARQYPVSPNIGKWGGEEWRPAILQALGFTLAQNGYRYVTEEKTRRAIDRETWGRYWAAISGLHTWSDGGKTWTVYVAHPAQGAVFVDMWTEHDPHGVLVPFGFNHPYWASKIKAFWWNAAWEMQWKFGPFSEASIGNVGLVPGKLGANTIVSTVTIGTGLAIGEDALDRYAIARWERKTDSLAARALLRTFLNPDRSFANVFRKKYPWYRDTRPTLRDVDP